MSKAFPHGWATLVRDLTTTALRDFDVEFLEMHADRGWLHVDVDDRHLGHTERHRLDRVVQGYVTQSLTTCMCCGSFRGRDRGERRVVTCDACEKETCHA